MTQIRDVPQSSTRHFVSLDGIRGLAAGAVVLYHVCLPLHVIVAVKAYLAVDLFFLLSGFVVANAYERRLLTRLTFLDFAAIRLIRLYPLFALGMAMGIVVSAMKAVVVLDAVGVSHFTVAAGMGMLMAPFGYLLYSTSDLLFPFNGPAWSLFFEIAVNFAYAFLVVRFRPRLIPILAVLSGLILVGAGWLHGSFDVGGQMFEFVGGMSRTSFSFFVGVMFYRVLAKVGPRHIQYSGLVAGAALVILLLFSPATNAFAFDCIAVLAVIPSIIALALCSQLSGAMRVVAARAGALSYALYITHYPVMRVFLFVAQNQHLGGVQLRVFIAVELAVILLVAQAALTLYDQPIQAFWKRRRNGFAISPQHTLGGSNAES